MLSKVAGGALVAMISSTGAWAAGPAPSPATPSCDFFQAQLIGVLCGDTAYVSPFGGGGQETLKRTIVNPGHSFHREGGGSTTYEKYDYDTSYEGLTLAVSPWQGLRLHVTGEAFQYNDTYWSQTAPSGGGGWKGSGVTTGSVSGGMGGWQGIGAEQTIWDRQTESGRYVLNVVGGLQMFPGGGPYSGRDLQQIGYTSGADWRLGGSGLSVAYFSSTLLQHFDNPGVVLLDSTSRLLLASDAYGVAIGPHLETLSTLAHDAGAKPGWSEVMLGGEALIEPFRNTKIAFLRDMTLDGTVTHSIGQANLVPNWAGSTSEWVYTAAARFNFRF